MESRAIESLGYGIIIDDFDAIHASTDDIEIIKNAVYQDKMVVLKNQQLSPDEFVSFGEKFGELRR